MSGELLSDLSKALNGSNVLAIRTLINTSVFKQGILGATRCVDVHARVGGEEFAGLLAQTNETNAFEVLERFRKALENTRITLKDGTELSITVSIGYCDFFDGLHDVDHWFNLADHALYQAKAQGRNRIIKWVPEPVAR